MAKVVILISKNNKGILHFFLISIVFVSLVCFTAQASCPNMRRYWEQTLQRKGFSADTPGQIIEAAQSESYFVRYIALRLLTDRTGQEAATTLKEALNDPHVKVRWTAAHLLGTLGDKSGLERMQLDFAELVPRNGAPEPADPNIAEDTKALEQWKKYRLYRISRALEVAKVMAELGSRRGYVLASTEGLENPLAAIRTRAVEVLSEIAKTDEAILAAEGKDPVIVLCVMAESEERITVFRRVRMHANHLGGTRGVRILEKAKNNPHQTDQELRWVRMAIDYLKEKKKTPKN
jgi:HEAT repeat protein